MYCQLCVIELK